jgi:hypothetical protein
MNRVIDDLYSKHIVLADGIVPAEGVLDSGNHKPQTTNHSARGYRPDMVRELVSTVQIWCTIIPM